MNNMANIIVTGASRGIGFELVQLFAKEGHRVLALSRNSAPTEGLAFKNVTSIPFDITDEDAFKALDTFLLTHWKTVDVLINNAGTLLNKAFSETSSLDFKKVYEVNVFGAAEMTRTVLPYMGKGGHVVNISSMGGVRGSLKFPGLAAYSSSKGALITLTELLAEEYKAQGPSFNVLALGAVQTEMLEEAFPGYEAPLTAAEMGGYIKDFALKGQRIYNGKLLEVSSSTP